MRPSLKVIRQELRAYVRLLMSRRPRNFRVLIFGQGRTGSTLLEDLLSSTGHFTKHGEILSKRARWVVFPAAYLKGRARARRDDNFICHVKPRHLDQDRRLPGVRRVDASAFLRSLCADGWTIIHIRRSDGIGQIVSELMARHRGSYHKHDDATETIELSVDPLKLMKSIVAKQKRDDAEAAALVGISVIDVEYDRDLKDPATHQATIDRILDALSLERRPAQSTLRKINVRPLSAVISNYDELAVCLHDQGLEHLLNEAPGPSSNTKRNSALPTN
jgi:LPS sulfotransferase NodH